jgi:formylmethanofuran dehydrogenase subunit E
MKTKFIRYTLLAVALAFLDLAQAETKEQWIALGTRIHGGFGPLIPVGIKIGLDAVDKLKPGPRDLAVIYYAGSKLPCPCIADGVMIATQVSPGQGTLQIAEETAPDGTTAIILIRNRKTGEALRYSITDEWLPKILAWSKIDPPARYDSAMSAEVLYQVEQMK